MLGIFRMAIFAGVMIIVYFGFSKGIHLFCNMFKKLNSRMRWAVVYGLFFVSSGVLVAGILDKKNLMTALSWFSLVSVPAIFCYAKELDKELNDAKTCSEKY